MRGKRVLIVDDNKRASEVLGRYCRAEGMRSDAVMGGTQVLDLLYEATQNRSPYDLVLLDQSIERITGSTLARMIRAMPEFSALPIVVLVPTGQQELKSLSISDEAIRVVTKPVRLRSLLNAMLRSFGQEVAEARPVATSFQKSLQGRILLAEDNRTNQEVAVAMLEGLGCEVEVADDGPSVLDMCQSADYDLILMDCLMPGLDGMETTKRIRERENGAKHRIPIVALTADVGIETRKVCLDAGMDDFLGKPIDVDELRTVLRERLGRHGDVDQEPPLSPVEADRPETGIGGSNTPRIVSNGSGRRLLDTDVIEEILALQRSDKPDLLEKVIALYVEGAEKLIERMKKGAAESDFEEIRAAAHSLKSSSAYIGANTIAAHARGLEALSKRNTMDGVDELLQSIDNDFSEVNSELRSLVFERTA